MNEFLFISVAVIALSLVLVALRFGTDWLIGLVAAYLLMANLFASKLSTVFGVTSSLAVPLYAAIFLATDIIAEHFGKKVAYKVVWVGFLAQVCMVVFGQLIVRAKTFGDPAVSGALSTIFGFIPRIVLGSFIAYLISQNFDVVFYHFLRTRCQGKHLWIRNNCSTIISQGLDTVIFLSIAFYGKLPNLIGFMLSVWIVKVGVAIWDTPFIYLSYWVLGKKYKAISDENRLEPTSESV